MRLHEYPQTMERFRGAFSGKQERLARRDASHQRTPHEWTAETFSSHTRDILSIPTYHQTQRIWIPYTVWYVGTESRKERTTDFLQQLRRLVGYLTSLRYVSLAFLLSHKILRRKTRRSVRRTLSHLSNHPPDGVMKSRNRGTYPGRTSMR